MRRQMIFRLQQRGRLRPGGGAQDQDQQQPDKSRAHATVAGNPPSSRFGEGDGTDLDAARYPPHSNKPRSAPSPNPGPSCHRRQPWPGSSPIRRRRPMRCARRCARPIARDETAAVARILAAADARAGADRGRIAADGAPPRRRGAPAAPRRRRDRCVPRRIRAVLAGGHRADVPRRGAAAHSRRGDRRPPDPRQARAGRLGAASRPFAVALRQRLDLGADADRPAGADEPAEQDWGAVLRRLVARSGEPVMRQAVTAAMRILGAPVRHGPHHRGGAGARRAGREAGLSPFLRHAGRGGAHRRRCRALCRRAIARRSPPSARTSRRRRPAPRRRASRSSSRRSIRATRKRSARACCASCCRASCRAGAGRRRTPASASPSTPRRPTGSISRSTSSAALAADAGARRLGRARPRGAGLSEARAAAHRLARRSGAAHRPAADGAARQGRLLGQRDQAQPGARPRSTIPSTPASSRPTCPTSPAPSGSSPRATRSSRNSRPTTRTRVAAVRALAGRKRDFEFQRLHGMGEALYDQIVGARRCRAASMRRSAGTRICWPISCAGCSRTAPTPRSSTAWSTTRRRSRRSSPIRSRGSRRSRSSRIRASRCRAISMAPSAATRAASTSAIRAALARAAGRARRRPSGAGRAPIIGGDARAGAAQAVRDPADRRRIVGTVVEADREQRRPRRSTAPRGAAPRWAARSGRGARRAASTAPPISSRRGCRDFMALIVREGGRTLPDALARGARGGRSLPLLRGARARRFRRAARRCRARPASATSSRCTAAASSAASRRGIFRWRSSPARSRRRSPRAMPSSPSRPSRRRSSPPPRCACCTRPAFPAAALASAAGRRAALGARAGRRSAHRRRRLHRLDRDRAQHRAGAGGARRADRPVHRRDRRPERADRRFDRAARAARRRRADLRPSTAPASAARRCACCSCRTRSPTACSPCSRARWTSSSIGDPALHRHRYRPGDRRGGARRARGACRAHARARAGSSARADAAAGHRARHASSRRAPSRSPTLGLLDARGVRADPACRALARRPARRGARRDRRHRLRPDARHPQPHRRDRAHHPPRGSASATSMSTAT